jgi:hypothetical protein
MKNFKIFVLGLVVSLSLCVKTKAQTFRYSNKPKNGPIMLERLSHLFPAYEGYFETTFNYTILGKYVFYTIRTQSYQMNTFQLSCLFISKQNVCPGNVIYVR